MFTLSGTLAFFFFFFFLGPVCISSGSTSAFKAYFATTLALILPLTLSPFFLIKEMVQFTL
jgi:hypothetical protein